MQRCLTPRIRNDLTNIPTSFLSRRSLLVADGARRLTKSPLAKTSPTTPPERAVLHALTLQTLFVDYAKARPPSEWNFQEKMYIVKLLEAYDSAVVLIEDQDVKEYLQEAMAFPLDIQSNTL